MAGTSIAPFHTSRRRLWLPMAPAIHGQQDPPMECNICVGAKVEIKLPFVASVEVPASGIASYHCVENHTKSAGAGYST